MFTLFRMIVVLCLMAGLLSDAGAAPQGNRPGDDPPTSSPATSASDAPRGTIISIDALLDAADAELPATRPSKLPSTPDELFAWASPSVVKLTVKDDDDREIGSASGFIIGFDREAYVEGMTVYSSTVITNYHVIYPAVSVDAVFSDQARGWASEVVTEDESVDLAVLTVSSLVKPSWALALRDTVHLPIGARVYTIGSPHGLDNSLSEGLISGYRRRGKHEPWIQTTAAISPGSSGGPLLSLEGRVIGVTTAFLSEGQNLNFAIPASEVARLLARNHKPRPIWGGASVRRTEEDAMLRATVGFWSAFAAAAPEEGSDTLSDEAFKTFRAEREQAGDQLAVLVRGNDLYASKQYAEACDVLRRATRADAGDYAYLAYFLLGKAVAADAERLIDFEDAIEPLKRARELNPDFAPAAYKLSSTYKVLSKYPEMLVEAESLVRLMPRCRDGYKLRGKAWAELGREEAFERDFKTALDLSPNDLDTLIAKGSGYSSLHRWPQAVETYERVIEIDEGNLPANYNLGNALQKMGRYAEAIASYRRAAKALGTDSPFEKDIDIRIAECRDGLVNSP